MKLLSIGADSKTVKGVKLGVLIGIMYLAPADVSGYQTCPKASPGCKASCLFTAGYAAVYKKINNSRIAKTVFFFTERARFFEQLVREIAALERRAAKLGLIPAIRLNGTSDIAWEKFRVIRDGAIYKNIFEAFPAIQFYDYTKILARKAALNIPNYSLTFSLSEINHNDAKAALVAGFNVAVVIEQGLKKAAKPAIFDGYPTVDGDESDARFLDPRGGHIVLLAAKGKARHDTTGFTRFIGEGIAPKRISVKIAA